MKCIFNKNSGVIYAYLDDRQDSDLMMDNWPDSDVTYINFIPSKKNVWNYIVDVETKQMVEKP